MNKFIKNIRVFISRFKKGIRILLGLLCIIILMNIILNNDIDWEKSIEKYVFDKFSLTNKDENLPKEQFPTLDFIISNKKSNTLTGEHFGEGVEVGATDFINFKTLSPDVRLNKIIIQFPSVMYGVKKVDGFGIVSDPFSFFDEFVVLPPNYQWDIMPLVKLLEVYYENNYSITEGTVDGYFNEEIPMSVSLNYTRLGEVHLLKSIYGINYNLLRQNTDHEKQKVEIVINNIYLIKNVTNPDKNIKNELNNVFNEIKIK